MEVYVMSKRIETSPWGVTFENGEISLFDFSQDMPRFTRRNDVKKEVRFNWISGGIGPWLIGLEIIAEHRILLRGDAALPVQDVEELGDTECGVTVHARSGQVFDSALLSIDEHRGVFNGEPRFSQDANGFYQTSGCGYQILDRDDALSA